MIYLNGQILPLEQAHVSLADSGLLYGFGFFETFRTSGGRPHHWRFNQTRLIAACNGAKFQIPPDFLVRDEPRLTDIVRTLLTATGVLDAVFRYTVTAGTEGRPTEFLTLRPLPAAPPNTGIALRLLKLRRDSGEWQPRPKSLNYTNALLGSNELASRSSDPSDEGLFLSQRDGWVTETPRQNIAWVNGDRMWSPDAASGAVAGTCLAWVRESDVRIEPALASVIALQGAEAVFCMNSVRGITPVREIWDQNDGRILQTYSSSTHPIVVRLQARWSEALAATASR